jgi:glycosyltransferase involved in cell wall biosynthesis
MNTISVIIPTYNSQRTIERAINSVLNQKGINELFKIELIICDDCSTDKTREIVSKYPCKIFKNSYNSGGPNWGRNKGIKEATGDYIAFLDHDDEWLPNKIKYQIEVIEKYNQDFAFSANVGQIGIKLNIIDQPDYDLYSSLLSWEIRKTGIYLGSVILKNNNVPLFRHRSVEYEWYIDTSKTRKCVRTIPMVIRHIHDNNLSQKESYRLEDYELLKKLLTKNAIRRKSASLARFYYKIGKYNDARKYFLLGNITIKNIGYYITSFIPVLARLIVKKYNVFG